MKGVRFEELRIKNYELRILKRHQTISNNIKLITIMNNLFRGAALFIGGAMVGAAAALLLAPKKGEEMRHDLANFAEEVAQKTREKIQKKEA